MPIQSLVSEPALEKITKLAEGGHQGAKQLATYLGRSGCWHDEPEPVCGSRSWWISWKIFLALTRDSRGLSMTDHEIATEVVV